VRIVYAASKYDYANPARGYSYEHYNFYESLLNLGHDILYFDLGTLLHERGRSGMNRRLLEVVESERPQLMFTVLTRNELDPAIVGRISADTSTMTVNWFCDDHWRFETFSRYWAPRFNCVVTTAESALSKYRAIGCQNVIKSQWACNHVRYRPLEVAPQYDVTFVGLPHGDRRFIIDSLRRAGIDVQVWGRGWNRGRISQDDMIRVFNQSRINLNLSNASPPKSLASRVVDAVTRSLENSPVPSRARELLLHRLALVRHVLAGRDDTSTHYPDQIKGRNFEVPGCRGFLLTGLADNLEHYYLPGREVACFAGIDELVRQIRYYLGHADERDAVARAGYARTMREHTYAHRFTMMFRRLGLPSAPLSEVLSGPVSGGSVEDVQ